MPYGCCTVGSPLVFTYLAKKKCLFDLERFVVQLGRLFESRLLLSLVS